MPFIDTLVPVRTTMENFDGLAGNPLATKVILADHDTRPPAQAIKLGLWGISPAWVGIGVSGIATPAFGPDGSGGVKLCRQDEGALLNLQLLDPVIGAHCATKSYVDTAVAAVEGSDVDSFNARTGTVLPASGDYPASLIPVTPVGGLAATDAQAAFAELDSEMSALVTGVSSVFGRTGAVVATAGDYSAALVSFAPTGSLSSVTVQAAIAELDSDVSALVTGVSSVFGRTGAVVSAIGDYSFSQISGSLALSQLTAGTNGQFLATLAGVPTWANVAFTDLSGAATNAQLPVVDVPHGGTGLSTLAAGSLVYGAGVGNMTPLAVGGAGTILVGGGAAPAYSITPTIGGLATIASALIGTAGSGVLFDDLANGQLAVTNAAGAALTSILFGPADATALKFLTNGSSLSVMLGDQSEYANAVMGGITSRNLSTGHQIILDQTESFVGGPTVVFLYGGTDEYYLSADNGVTGGRLNASTSLLTIGAGAAIKGETATKMVARNALDTAYINFQADRLIAEISSATFLANTPALTSHVAGITHASGDRRLTEISSEEFGPTGTASGDLLYMDFGSDVGATSSGAFNFLRCRNLNGLDAFKVSQFGEVTLRGGSYSGGSNPHAPFVEFSGGAFGAGGLAAAGRLVGGRSTGASPTLSNNFPTSGDFGTWINTTLSRSYFVMNRSGTLETRRLGTLAAAVALVDSTGGTATGTLAALTNLSASPAALGDAADRAEVNTKLSVLRDSISSLAAKIATIIDRLGTTNGMEITAD